MTCAHTYTHAQELRSEKEAVEAKMKELEDRQVELDRLKYRAKLEVR